VKGCNCCSSWRVRHSRGSRCALLLLLLVVVVVLCCAHLAPLRAACWRGRAAAAAHTDADATLDDNPHYEANRRDSDILPLRVVPVGEY